VEPGFRTPLLDFFRRGEVAADVRMLAARGALAPRAHEQLALLILLTSDSDPSIRQAAETTLGNIPVAALAAFLARPDAGADVRAFFAERGVAPAPGPARESDDPLIEEPAEEAGAEDEGEAAPEGAAQPRLGTVQRLANMTVAERMKAAMRGTREERTVLIRDPNKLVSLSVLSGPKVNETEIETYARMSSVSEEVLRVIGTTRAWVKNYAVMAALVRNPKTPIAISLGFVNRLNERDTKMLGADRNVAESVRTAARRIIAVGESRKH
jgi:hypothetical protein